MDGGRRELVVASAAFLYGMSGCLFTSERETGSESILIGENQRSTAVEFEVRSKDGADVVVEELFRVSAGKRRQVEFSVSRDVTQLTLVADVLAPREASHEERVPGGVPEYTVTIEPGGLEVVWTEN